MAHPVLGFIPGCQADMAVGALATKIIAGEPEVMIVTDPGGRLAISVVVTEDRDGDSGRALVDLVELYIRSGPLCMRVGLGAVERFNAEAWQRLATGEDATMTFTQTNGEVTISSKKGEVAFTVCRRGNDDQSEITIRGSTMLFSRIFAYIGLRVGAIHKAAA